MDDHRMSDANLPPPFPLSWPEGKQRTPPLRREKGRYNNTSVQHALGSLDNEMMRWRSHTGARVTAYELTASFSGRGRDPDDPGAALWFLMAEGDATIGQQLMTIACAIIYLTDQPKPVGFVLCQLSGRIPG
jgi:hypothetical protein